MVSRCRRGAPGYCWDDWGCRTDWIGLPICAQQSHSVFSLATQTVSGWGFLSSLLC